MSACAAHINAPRRLLGLLAVAVGVLVLSITLLVWVGTPGGSSNPSTPAPMTEDPRGVVTDGAPNPWEANNPGLVTP